MFDLIALHAGDPKIPIRCYELIALIKLHGYDTVLAWVRAHHYSEHTIEMVKQVCKLK